MFLDFFNNEGLTIDVLIIEMAFCLNIPTYVSLCYRLQFNVAMLSLLPYTVRNQWANDNYETPYWNRSLLVSH